MKRIDPTLAAAIVCVIISAVCLGIMLLVNW